MLVATATTRPSWLRPLASERGRQLPPRQDSHRRMAWPSDSTERSKSRPSMAVFSRTRRIFGVPFQLLLMITTIIGASKNSVIKRPWKYGITSLWRPQLDDQTSVQSTAGGTATTIDLSVTHFLAEPVQPLQRCGYVRTAEPDPEGIVPRAIHGSRKQQNTGLLQEFTTKLIHCSAE